MKKLEKVFDIIGEILAVVLVLVFALLIINANFNFLPDLALKIFTVIKEYGALLLIGVVGFEAMCKRNIIFRIIFLLLIALIVIFLFFPDTYANFINLID